MSKKIRIYHNPRCRKSREALALISDKGEIEIIDYMNEGLDIDKLKEDVDKMQKKASEIVRKNESVFKDKYKGKEMSQKDWFEAFLEHPRLLERPIVVLDEKAVLGRPPEEVLKLF